MLQKEQLKHVLSRQRELILKKPIGIERGALGDVGRKIKLPHVVTLTGIRRCGKSTLLRQIIKKFYGDEEFYYINFEDERLSGFDASGFNEMYEALVELFGERRTFFIDEIQNVKGFEAFVRRFYDEGFKFYITGSNAKLLGSDLGTKLTGRHVDIVLKPFSFIELLSFRGFSFDEGTLYRTEARAAVKKHFDEYLAKGGMPEYLTYDDDEILSRTYEDIVVKDVIARHHIENAPRLKELYRYAINNFSNRFSYNSLKQACKENSVNTVQSHIARLEETHLVKVINRFDYSLKKQMANDKKLYVADVGFIHAVSAKFTKDAGWALENMVFNALSGGPDVYYYSKKRECDFVLSKNRKVTAAIQVAWELNENSAEREKAGLLEAMDEFGLGAGLILTYDQEDELRARNKKITVKPVWKWLLQQSMDKDKTKK